MKKEYIQPVTSVIAVNLPVVLASLSAGSGNTGEQLSKESIINDDIIDETSETSR